MAKRTATDDRLETRIPEDNRPGHEPDVIPDKPLVPPAAYRTPENRPTPPLPGAPELDDGLSVRHAFRFDPRFYGPAAVVGVLPATTYVEVDGEHLHVRFGPWSLDTPIDNVDTAETTGPYALLKVMGPPHLSFTDRGVTFATNRDTGLCIRFHEPVAALAPFGLLRHPAATVTVADPIALGRDLDRVRSTAAG
jgi:hypothetical protein